MTVFVDWAFRASGAPASGARTMPERLSDIVNVKDWGANGTGGNDTAAIQAAIDYAMEEKDGGVRGGIVFFPQGRYLVSGPLIVGGAVDAPVILMGCGKDATLLGRTTSPAYADPGSIGYMISSGTEAVDCLAKVQGLGASSAGINIRGTRDGVVIDDCELQPATTLSEPIGLDVSSATGALVRGCDGTTSKGTHESPTDASPGDIRGCRPDTIGIALGNASTAVACNMIGGFEIAYALSGEGSSVLGCRAEVVGNGVRVGWGPDGETPSYGATVQGVQTERNAWAYVLYNATGCMLAGNYTGQSAGLPLEEACSLSWSSAAGGTVTVTTAAHNVAAGTYVIQITAVPAAWLPPSTTAGIVEVTRASTTTFTYPLTPDPTGSPEAGLWSWPMQYSLRVRKAYECAIIGNQLLSNTEHGIDLDYDSEAEHRNCVFAACRSNYGWVLPTTTTNLAAWTFIGVGNTAAIPFPDSTSVLYPVGTMTFADLPTGSGVQDGPYEGQEFNITDGNSSAFDATQTGGGSGNYKVRYNGTVWKRVG